MFKLLFLIFSLAAQIFLISSAFASEKLIFAIDIIRHGDRTPLIEIPTVPHHWQEGVGQLTSMGMSQEYQLGKRLRNKYVRQYHLLPKHYSIKTMYVQSTEYERTVMSAQSLLLGLYPLSTGPKKPESQTYALPYGYQPIPIFTKSKQEDNSLRLFNDRPLFGKLLQKYVFSTPEWIEKEPELKRNMVKWRVATGLPLIDPMQLIELADTLYIYQLYHVPLRGRLSQDDVKEIMDTAHWQWTVLYKNPSISSVAGSALLKTIVEQLQHATQNHTELKYMLFSAHDVTILMQMANLDAALNEWPRYASLLNFSLFDEGSQNYSVKITYNNQPVFIPACNGFSCDLDALIQLAHEKEALSNDVLVKLGT